MKLPKNQEIQPEPFKTDIQPQPFTQSELIELFQSKGMISEAYGGYTLTPKGTELLKRLEKPRDEIIAWGHPNISATHRTTFEITKDKELGKEGNCIIGVKANKACIDLDEELKVALKEGKDILITIEADGIVDFVRASGSPELKFTDEKDIVVRKSDFIDERTLAIKADKAAKDLRRDLIEKLKNPKTKLRILIEVI